MIEVYDTTFACVGEIKRGMLVRRLAGFHVVIDSPQRFLIVAHQIGPERQPGVEPLPRPAAYCGRMRCISLVT